MSIEDFIITVYCLVDNELKKLLEGKRLRSRGFEPKLSDAEVITMDIVGEFLGQDTDTGIWRYFKNHWLNSAIPAEKLDNTLISLAKSEKSLRKINLEPFDFKDKKASAGIAGLNWFPCLGSRVNYVKQSANLWRMKQKIQSALVSQMGALVDGLHMADGLPMPVCHFKRARGSEVFRGNAAYGYCASKSETYYGFKGNLVISSEGIITGITVTAANIDERESLWDIIDNIEGLVIADKGLIGEDYQKQIRAHTAINVQMPTRNNMNDPRGKDCNRWLTSTRRLVETVIGQLTEQFNIEKIRARDLWHLTSRVGRKVLAHTVAIWVNKIMGYPPLQFERLGIA